MTQNLDNETMFEVNAYPLTKSTLCVQYKRNKTKWEKIYDPDKDFSQNSALI